MRTRTSLAVVAIGAVMLLVTGCGAPVQKITFGDGSLGLQGASITVPLVIKCRPGWNIAYGDANIAQASGDKLAQGFGTFENVYPGVPCTGNPQLVSVVVFDSSPWVFRVGTAAASGDVSVYNPDTTEIQTSVANPREIAVFRADPQPNPQKAAQPARDPRFKQR